MSSEFSGSEAAAAIRAALESCAAGAVFGLPGGSNHALFTALRGASARLIVPTHELAAAFMAGSYGRVSGRPGILLTIPGPGFAYALAGIAEAWQDSAPLVHIVTTAWREPRGRHGHQALDQAAIARPIAKAVLGVGTRAEITPTVRRAFELALEGEPGPVIVQLGAPTEQPDQIAHARVEEAVAAEAIWGRIRHARKPVLLLGQGCVATAAAIRAYVERTGTPVFTTPSGRGVLDERSAWCLGYDPVRETTPVLNALLREADLVVAVGARLSHNGSAGFGLDLPSERLVHVDASRGNLAAVYPASCVAAVSAQAFFAMAQNAELPRTAWTLGALTPWRAKIRTFDNREPEPTIAGEPAAHFFSGLRAALPNEALIVTDSGLHQVLARRYLDVQDVHGLLMPTDLQAMGFALPSAIAAKLAAPSRTVVVLIGDGGVLMSGLELAVAVRERLALTVIVFNDGYLNQIRMQQLRDGGREYGVDLPALDFAALAQAVGARYGLAATQPDELVSEAIRGGGVTLIEVPVRDGTAIRAAAVTNRLKAVGRRAMGTHWLTLKSWLRG
jgi:acetolactate synthase I/II/III large subunit